MDFSNVRMRRTVDGAIDKTTLPRDNDIFLSDPPKLKNANEISVGARTTAPYN